MEWFLDNGVSKIYHGSFSDVLPTIPETAVIITDPPFNIGYGYNEYVDKMQQRDYEQTLLLACRSPSVVIHYPEALHGLSMAKKETPLRVISWVYPSNTPRQHRDIAFYGVKPDFRMGSQPYRNPRDKRIAKRIAEGKTAKLYDWWEINQVKNVSKDKTTHPCQMPLEVMRRIIQITKPSLVFDPFMGSGTTLLAAQLENVPSIGCDISAEYCGIAANRITALAQKGNDDDH